MTNASPRIFSAIVFLVPWNLVSAFPSLAARGDCDSIVCPSDILNGVSNGADAAWNGAAGLFGAGIDATRSLAGWTINEASGLLEPPKTGSATPNFDTAPKADSTLNFVGSPDVDNTPKDDNANTDSFGLISAPAPLSEIDGATPPLKTGECDFASAVPSLQDLNSNQVCHSYRM